MDLRFCPKCGGLMIKDYNLKEKMEKKPEDEVIVMEKDISLETLPTTKTQCPKCEHMKAYWWLMQTRSVDEAPTRFYQCCKCNHKWREYQ